MGTRISLGRGFTFGASGLRYGRSIPGVPRSYVSTGRSGTLITGLHLRHWQPAVAAGAGAGYAAGRRRSGGGPVRRTPGQWAEIRSTTADLRASTARYEGLQVWARDYLAGLSPEVRAAMALTPDGREALAHADGTHPGYLAARDQLARCEAVLAGAPRRGTCDRSTVFTILAVLAVVVGLVWATYAQQAGFHAADQASGLAAARAAGAPGICIDDDAWNMGNMGGMRDGHYYWTVSKDGTCDPNLRVHFVPAN